MPISEAILIIALCGAVGSFANMFNNGFHPPEFSNDIWTPGWIGALVVGTIAAVAAWSATRTDAVPGMAALQLKDLSYAIVIGFGGGKWLTTESDKRLLRKTAAVAASKSADHQAAAQIAAATPRAALAAALAMK